MLIHRLCEAYPGVTPKDIEELTLDQIYIMTLGEDALKTEGTGVQKMSYESAAAKGIVPASTESLAKRIAREQAEAAKAAEEAYRREKKRQKRNATRQARKQAEARQRLNRGTRDGI